MSSIWNYLVVLMKISLSQYETNFLFKYSVNYTLPAKTGAYFSSRINEAMNFSSITTGVAKDFYLKTYFKAKDKGAKLALVHANNQMANPGDTNFMAYQRDFFDVSLGGNASRFVNCSTYFGECPKLNESEFTSTMEQGAPTREDYFLINANLLREKKEDPAPTGSLGLHFATEASVTLLHVKMSDSFYYLILTGIGLHSIVLLFNVISLMRKRNALQAVITKHKAQ